MKIYVAAPFQLRAEAISVMHHLESLGHYVTSRWLKDDEDPFDTLMQPTYAAKSRADVKAASLLLIINPLRWAERGTGGRHYECGLADAWGKQIVLVGERTNVFHHLAQVRVIERVEDL